MQVKNPEQSKTTNTEKPSFFDQFMEIVGWLQIAVSPTLIGAVVAVMLYYFIPTSVGLILAIVVALAGLTIGIVWATKKWKRKGTIDFLSRVIATPELDNKKDDV